MQVLLPTPLSYEVEIRQFFKLLQEVSRAPTFRQTYWLPFCENQSNS